MQLWGDGVSAGNTIETQSGRECRTWCRRDGGILASYHGQCNTQIEWKQSAKTGEYKKERLRSVCCSCGAFTLL
jgi:hypothetical protein